MVTNVLQGSGNFRVARLVLPLFRAKSPQVDQRPDGNVIHAFALFADFQRFGEDAAQAVAHSLRAGIAAVVDAHQLGIVAVGGHAVIHRFEFAIDALFEGIFGGIVKLGRDAHVPEGAHGFARESAHVFGAAFATGHKEKRCCQ